MCHDFRLVEQVPYLEDAVGEAEVSGDFKAGIVHRVPAGIVTLLPLFPELFPVLHGMAFRVRQKKEQGDNYGENEYLENPENYDNLMQNMYNKEWVVYCKEPFNNAESVIKYLGRYTHRVAISNDRIVKVEDDKITLKWRDYKDNNKMKEMTITIEEFIRRFLIKIYYHQSL